MLEVMNYYAFSCGKFLRTVVHNHFLWWLIMLDMVVVCRLYLEKRNPECGRRNAEFGIRNTECGIQNAEYGTECGIRNAEYAMRNTECGIRNA